MFAATWQITFSSRINLHIAATAASEREFCFTLNSGHSGRRTNNPLCAISGHRTTLFDHRVGGCKQRWRNSPVLRLEWRDQDGKDKT